MLVKQVPVFHSKELLNRHLQQQKVSEKEALKLAEKYCHQITLICRSMNFPYYTIATAQHLFHKFFAANSFADFIIEDVVIACVFLASKMEETIKKAKDIIVTSYPIVKGEAVDDMKELEKIKKHIIDIEQRLLEACGFDFHYTQPHKFIIKFAKKMRLSSKVARLAWNIIQNSYKSTLSLQYPQHLLAFASLLISREMYAKHASVGSMSKLDARLLKCDLVSIREICDQIFSLFAESENVSSAFKQEILSVKNPVMDFLK